MGMLSDSTIAEVNTHAEQQRQERNRSPTASTVELLEALSRRHYQVLVFGDGTGWTVTLRGSYAAADKTFARPTLALAVRTAYDHWANS